MSNLQERIHLETMKLEELKLKVDVWKTVVDVQKHFNDLEMKVRNFGVLILSAFIGAIGVCYNSNSSLIVLGNSFSVVSLLSFGAAIIWMLFYFVDIYWFHPLLKGAVTKGLALEQEIAVDLVNIDLTKAIGDSSSKDFLFFKGLHSEGKANIFYLGILFVIIIFFLCMLLNNVPAKKNQLEMLKIEAQCKRKENFDGYNCSMESLPVNIK